MCVCVCVGTGGIDSVVAITDVTDAHVVDGMLAVVRVYRLRARCALIFMVDACIYDYVAI